MPYQVPTSTVPILADPPFVAALVLLGTAIGWRALRLLGTATAEATRLERGVVSAALGLGFLQYVPFALGMANALTPKAVWIALGVAAVLFVPDMLAVLRGLWRARRLALRERPRWLLALGALLGLTLLGALVAALAPPTDIDGIYYQLTAPKRWLQQGDLAYLPTLLQTNLPMGVNMLFTLAMAVWSDTAAKLIHFAFGVLTLLAIVALGRRIRSVEVGLTAAALWLLGLFAVPTLDALRLFTWAYVDLGITFEIMCAALTWVLWQRTGSKGWLVVSALTAGFAASFKLTGAVTGAALGLMVLWVEWQRRRAPVPALALAAGFVALSVLPALPWFVRSWVQTGSPVYPMLAKLLPTRDWPPEAAAAFGDYFKYYVWGTGYSSSSWSLGSRKLLRGAALLGTLGVTGVVVWRLRDWESRALSLLSGIFTFFCVMSTGLYVRYLVPILPLVYLVAAGTRPLERLLISSRATQAVVLLLVALNSVLFFRSTPLSRNVMAATGSLSREAYVAAEIPVAELWRYVNTAVPANARILLAAGRPSYYMDPYCYVTEAYYQSRIRMDTWQNFVSDLRRDGVGYAIVHEADDVPLPLGPRYAAVENEFRFARRLAREHGELLYASGTDHLYRLHGLGAAATPRETVDQEHAGP